MLGTIIINTVCIFFDCLNLLPCYRYFSLCLVLYVLTYFNTFSLTHCVCTYWWITYFHSQLSLWNGWSVLRYLFTNTFFPTGQWSSFEMSAISFLLSLFSLPQSCIICSTVWLPLAQGHTVDSIILNRCRYDLGFPWAVTIAVKLVVKVIFIFSLSLILGKNSLVAVPFVVLSYSYWHFLVLISLSCCSISLLGNLE